MIAPQKHKIIHQSQPINKMIIYQNKKKDFKKKQLKLHKIEKNIIQEIKTKTLNIKTKGKAVVRIKKEIRIVKVIKS